MKMCARFNLRISPAKLAEIFALTRQIEFIPRFNIAPTQQIVVIRNGDPSMMRWGLLPSWMTKPGPPLINARAETVATKPAFRSAFKKRRCIIPATGFYEWKSEGKAKLPFHIQTVEPMAFAGLWESKDGAESATIVTTEANESMTGLHDRMPVILHRDAWEVWQNEGPEELLKPWDGAMTVEPISPVINSVKNEGPDLLIPIGNTASELN